MTGMKKLALSLALGSALATAFAQSSDVRMDVNLKDASLTVATQMITQKTGVQFVFTGAKAFGKVTTQLKNMPVDDVIRYICDAAGAYVTKDANGVYVISSEKPAETVAPQQATKAAKVLKRIKLLHSGADEIYSKVVMNELLDPLSPHKKMGRAVEMARKMASPMGSVNGQAPSFFDSYSKFNQYTPQATGSQSTLDNGGVDGNSINVPGESAKQRGGAMGAGGGGLGQGGGGLGQGGGGLGQGGGGLGQGGGGGTQLQGGQGLVPDGIDHITYDPTDNSLIVRGTSDAVDELRKIIIDFDRAPEQVSIKVEFITTTENVDRSLGYSIQYSRGSIITGMEPTEFIRSSDPVFLTYATGDAVMRLRTRLSEGYGRVVTAPLIRTVNNTPATVSAFTNDWILIAQTVASGVGGVPITTVQPQQLTIGTSLSVTPRINGDRTISMGIAPTVSSVTGTRSVSSTGVNFELPIFTQQSVFAVAIIPNGETIVLGGLNTDSTNSLVNRVPILSDLPILGQFFKRTTKQKTSSELLIFVTPKIVETDENGIGL